MIDVLTFTQIGIKLKKLIRVFSRRLQFIQLCSNLPCSFDNYKILVIPVSAWISMSKFSIRYGNLKGIGFENSTVRWETPASYTFIAHKEWLFIYYKSIINVLIKSENKSWFYSFIDSVKVIHQLHIFELHSNSVF